MEYNVYVVNVTYTRGRDMVFRRVTCADVGPESAHAQVSQYMSAQNLGPDKSTISVGEQVTGITHPRRVILKDTETTKPLGRFSDAKRPKYRK